MPQPARKMVQSLKFRKGAEGFNAKDIESAIERGYMAGARGDKFTKKTSFAPSSIGGYNGVCARYWYQAFDGAMFINSTDSQGLANMKVGSDAHTRLEGLFDEGGILVEAEREFRVVDPPIHGFIDVVVNTGGDDIVGELKTTRESAFRYRVTTHKPMVQHLYQILIYMDSQDMEWGFLFYENKDDQTFIVIPVQMTPENRARLDEAYNWMRLVRMAWENRTLPERQFSAKSKPCKGCPLFKECWDNPTVEVGTIKIKSMDVPPIA